MVPSAKFADYGGAVLAYGFERVHGQARGAELEVAFSCNGAGFMVCLIPRGGRRGLRLRMGV